MPLLYLLILEAGYGIYKEASRGTGAQNGTVNVTGCGFDPHSRELNIYFHFASLWCQSKAQR